MIKRLNWFYLLIIGNRNPGTIWEKSWLITKTVSLPNCVHIRFQLSSSHALFQELVPLFAVHRHCPPLLPCLNLSFHLGLSIFGLPILQFPIGLKNVILLVIKLSPLRCSWSAPSLLTYLTILHYEDILKQLVQLQILPPPLFLGSLNWPNYDSQHFPFKNTVYTSLISKLPAMWIIFKITNIV